MSVRAPGMLSARVLSPCPFRQFTKAIAACADGSQFLAVVVPEAAAAGLPPISPTSG